MRDLVNKFEEEYDKKVQQIKKTNIKKNCIGKLPGRYIAKILYEWDDKKFDWEY